MNTQPNAAGQGSALFPACIPEPLEGSVEPLNGSCRGLTLPVVTIRLAAESTVAVPYGVRAKVNCTADAAAILRPYFRDKATEEFVVMLLSSAGHVTAIGRAAMGGLSGVSVEPRTVFQFALLGNAASIIVAHNHPSGNPEPSETDVALTRQLVAAGKVMGIPVLDHVIVAGSAHSSVMQDAAKPSASFPVAPGTLPGTTPEPMQSETHYPALAANEPRAGYTPETLSANEPERPYLCSNGDSERHHAACESIEVLLHKDDFTTQVCRLVLRMLSLRNCGFILVEYSHEFMELVSLIAEVVGETGLTLDEANLLISADLTHDKRNPSTTAPAVKKLKELPSASRWFGPGFPSGTPSVKEPPADYSSIPQEERERRFKKAFRVLGELSTRTNPCHGVWQNNIHAKLAVAVNAMAIALNHGAGVSRLEPLFWKIEEIAFCTEDFGATGQGFTMKMRDRLRDLQDPTRQDTCSPGGSIPDSSLLGEPRHEYNPDPGPVFRQKLFSMVAMTGDNLTIYLTGQWVETTRPDGEKRTMLGLDFDVDVNRETLGVPPSVNEPRSQYTPEPVTTPVRGAIVARTTRANGLTTTVYFTTRLVWVVGDDGELRRTFQLNFEAETEGLGPCVSEPTHRYNHATPRGFDGLRKRRYEHAYGELHRLKKRWMPTDERRYYQLVFHTAFAVLCLRYGNEEVLEDVIYEMMYGVFEGDEAFARDVGLLPEQCRTLLETIAPVGTRLAMPVDCGDEESYVDYESPYRANEPEADYGAGGGGRKGAGARREQAARG